jgi:hypothetical protein
MEKKEKALLLTKLMLAGTPVVLSEGAKEEVRRAQPLWDETTPWQVDRVEDGQVSIYSHDLDDVVHDIYYADILNTEEERQCEVAMKLHLYLTVAESQAERGEKLLMALLDRLEQENDGLTYQIHETERRKI